MNDKFKAKATSKPKTAKKPVVAKKPLKITKFESLSPVAQLKIKELLTAGAVLEEDTRSKVSFSRMGKKVTVDQMGRVEWVV